MTASSSADSQPASSRFAPAVKLRISVARTMNTSRAKGSRHRFQYSGSGLLYEPAPEVGDDFARGIMARRAGYTAARMRARSAHVQSLQRTAIVAVPEHGPRREHLVQAQGAVKDVAADQPEGALEIERAHDLPPEHRGLEIGRMTVDEIDHDIGYLLPMIVPGCPVGQLRRDVLAEQARHVLSRGREAVVQGRGYEHLDDGLLRPAAGLGIEIRLFHVGKAGRHDDAGGVMLGGRAPRQDREVGQLRQRDVHPKGARSAAPVSDALAKILR